MTKPKMYYTDEDGVYEVIEPKHTPLPWKIEECGDTCSILNRECNDDGWDIGEIYNRCNADFIVKTVNCHEQLVKALKHVKHICSQHDEWFIGEFSNEINAALAAAEAQ